MARDNDVACARGRQLLDLVAAFPLATWDRVTARTPESPKMPAAPAATKAPRTLARPTLMLALVLAVAAWPSPSRAELPQDHPTWNAETYLRQQLEPVFHPLPDNEEILTLENGLVVVLLRNPAQPMVGIYTQVKVGSAYEDFRTSGMSHMLEHLLFNGTEQYTQEELYEAADRHGAYNNANTTDFYTNFMMVLPAEHLKTGLQLQAQMLFHSTLPPEKFEKEKGIVVGELVSARDNPGHFAEVTEREVFYAGSSLELPTLGTRSTIEHMVRDDVAAFYHNFYVPNNMITTIAGNFDRQEALDLLEQTFGQVPPGTVQRPPLQPAGFLERTQSITRRGGDRRVVALAFDAPGYGASDFFPYLVLTRLLDAPGSGILTQALATIDQADRPQPAVWWEKAGGFSRLVVEFELPPQADPAAVWHLVQDAATAALDRGITPEDVEETIQVQQTETLLEREQLRELGIMTAESLVLGGPDFFVDYLPQLKEVKAENVAQVLNTYLIDVPCLALLIEPDAASATSAAAGGAAGGGMPAPASGSFPPAMLEAMRKAGMTPPAPVTTPPEKAGKDRSQRGGTAAGSERKTAASGGSGPLAVEGSELSNGTVLVTQQNATSPLMAIHLTVRDRAVLDDGHPGALNIVHRMLLSGVSGCDETCLARKVRRLGAVIKLVDNPNYPMDDYYTTGRFSFIRVEVAAENGPALLELLAALTRHASFTEDDFARERAQQIALLEQRQASARVLADQLLRQTLYGSHPLARPPEGDVASLSALTYEQALDVYHKAFAPENLIIAIVSPYAHHALADQIEQLLPGTGHPAGGLPPLPLTETPQRITGNLGGEMGALRMGALLRVQPEDVSAAELLVAILSDRLAMDLREKRGLSYSAGAAIGLHGGEGEFVAWLNPPRERLTEGEEALRAFLSDFDAATITQDELATIRSARQGRLMMRRLSSISQAYYLAMAELDGDVASYNEALSAYDTVTLKDLQHAAGKYLKGLPLVTVVVN